MTYISRVETRQNALKPGKNLYLAEIWQDDSGPCPEKPKKIHMFWTWVFPFLGL